MELTDFLSDEILAFCSDDTELNEDIDVLFASAFDTLLDAIPDSAPTNVIPDIRCKTSPTPTCSYTPTHSSSAGRFAPPKTDREVQEARNKGIPKKTLEDTNYCVKVWEEWCSYRQHACRDTIPPLQSIEPSQL